MIVDQFGGQHTSKDDAAAGLFAEAVDAIARHRPAHDSLQRLAMRYPDFAAAAATAGLCHILLGSGQATRDARQWHDRAVRALNSHGGGTPGEHALVDCLQLALGGAWQKAAERLEFHLEAAPRDFLAIKLAHALRFMTGGREQMLAVSAEVLPFWDETMPGYGFLLGCHAFALGECGVCEAAEVTGRQAVALEADDVWGLHAVAHVLETKSRTADGVCWLEPTRGLWRKSAGFGMHLAWHLALFRLGDGEPEEALALYDSAVVPTLHCDFRDMMNAVSLLWRLEQDGVTIGSRWEHLHGIAGRRSLDTDYALGSLHDLLALVAAGDCIAARSLLQRMRDGAAASDRDQARVLARIGVPLGETIVAAAECSQLKWDLTRLALALPALGGSAAQRDVFLRELLLIACRAGDDAGVAAITRLRLQERCFDQFQAKLERRLVRGAGKSWRQRLGRASVAKQTGTTMPC